ncbi:MAG: Hsp20/alpha crystallin family protein [Bacteroidota bacterium]
MIRPGIKSYHGQRRQHWIKPITDRPYFLGKSALDLRWDHATPAVNIQKNDQLYQMDILIPGFRKEEIRVTVDDTLLTIRAERKRVDHPDTEFILREFGHNKVVRQFLLTNDIGHEAIEATYANGILTLTFRDVPEEEETVVKTIAVK